MGGGHSLRESPEAETSKDVKTGVAKAECRIREARAEVDRVRVCSTGRIVLAGVGGWVRILWWGVCEEETCMEAVGYAR